MELSQQVTNLELSKRLKELGVRYESKFYWCSDLGEVTFSKDCGQLAFKTCKKHLSVFGPSELSEMLPWDLKEIGSLNISQTGRTFSVEYISEKIGIVHVFDLSMVNAMAKMLIHLLENGLVKSEGLTKE